MFGTHTGRGAGPKFILFRLSFACTAGTRYISPLRYRTQVHFTPLRVVQAWLSALIKKDYRLETEDSDKSLLNDDIYNARKPIHFHPRNVATMPLQSYWEWAGPKIIKFWLTFA